MSYVYDRIDPAVTFLRQINAQPSVPIVNDTIITPNWGPVPSSRARRPAVNKDHIVLTAKTVAGNLLLGQVPIKLLSKVSLTPGEFTCIHP